MTNNEFQVICTVREVKAITEEHYNNEHVADGIKSDVSFSKRQTQS